MQWQKVFDSLDNAQEITDNQKNNRLRNLLLINSLRHSQLRLDTQINSLHSQLRENQKQLSLNAAKVACYDKIVQVLGHPLLFPVNSIRRKALLAMLRICSRILAAITNLVKHQLLRILKLCGFY